MAETSTAGGAGEKKDGVDEAEEKLLQENHALIVPAVNREDGVAVKASKKGECFV